MNGLFAMPAVPFPVLTLSLLSLLLLTLCWTDRKAYRRAITFIIPCILLISLNALRWAYPFPLLKLGQLTLAAILPALAWWCFAGLARGEKIQHWIWHGPPMMMIFFISVGFPSMIDAMLFLLYSGYGFSLILLGRRGSDQFVLTRLSDASLAANLAMIAGVFLSFSAVTDLLVSLEFVFHQGQFAPRLVAILQGLMLPFIALAIVFAGKTRPQVVLPVLHDTIDNNDPLDAVGPTTEQAELSTVLENVIREKQLFLDANLTLNILARKSGIPARQISRAINAAYGCNVSQWINGFRIEHAQQLLLTSTRSVTDIMLDTGFITKSNFNREFLRITGMTPTAFRQQGRSGRTSESH